MVALCCPHLRDWPNAAVHRSGSTSAARDSTQAVHRADAWLLTLCSTVLAGRLVACPVIPPGPSLLTNVALFLFTE